jgi:hypothetical protein
LHEFPPVIFKIIRVSLIVVLDERLPGTDGYVSIDLLAQINGRARSTANPLHIEAKD